MKKKNSEDYEDACIALARKMNPDTKYYTTEEVEKILGLNNMKTANKKTVLKERRKKLLAERKEILRRYDSKDADELELKIEKGQVPEHPAWEDFIELENLDYELRQVE